MLDMDAATSVTVKSNVILNLTLPHVFLCLMLVYRCSNRCGDHVSRIFHRTIP